MHDNKMDVAEAKRRPSYKATNDSFKNHHFISAQGQSQVSGAVNPVIERFSFNELDPSPSIDNFSQYSI